jgi:REP element-mobilizing transposase RayT
MPSPRINKAEKDETYFITITVIDWIPIFISPDYFEIILEALKHHCSKNEFRLLGYVIMTNHIHLMINSPDSIKFLISFKSYTTYRILKKLKENNKSSFINLLIKQKRIWQKTNMPILIYSEKFFQEKLNYIHNNPVVKEYVDSPEEWIYSSARNYYNNDHSIIYIENEIW